MVESSSAEAALPREAIVFVPGISDEATDQSIEGVAARLAAAMDRNALTASARFRVGDVRDMAFGGQEPVRAATIYREDVGNEEAVADIYRVGYGGLLLEKYRKSNPLMTILRVVLLLVPMFARLVGSVRNRVMTGKEKVQVALAIVLLGLLAFYLVLLVGGLVATAEDLFGKPAGGEERPVEAASGRGGATATPPQRSTDAAERSAEPAQRVGASAQQAAEGGQEAAADPPRAGRWIGGLRARIRGFGDLVAFLALVLTAAGFVFPARAQVRQRLTDAAILVTALGLYFQAGRRRRVLSGWLHTVLQRIEELGDVEYAKVRILTYSFGSIIALDTLFPDRDSAVRPPARIDSLVTIGSPFDFVQLLWPRYFEQRKGIAGLQWVNIYSPEDVLSSNFRSHSKLESMRGAQTETADEARVLGSIEAPENIPYRLRLDRDELRWRDLLLFVGFRSHSMYWEPGDTPQHNVFDDTVARLYEGHAALR